MDRNAPMTTLNLASWTFLVSKRSASVKNTTVLEFRVYVESLTRAADRKRNLNEMTDYFVCTANAHAWMSYILCQYAPARTIRKSTRPIMAEP